MLKAEYIALVYADVYSHRVVCRYGIQLCLASYNSCAHTHFRDTDSSCKWCNYNTEVYICLHTADVGLRCLHLLTCCGQGGISIVYLLLSDRILLIELVVACRIFLCFYEICFLHFVIGYRIIVIGIIYRYINTV
ncbi:hypothetical protein D3C86_1365070 [compost metagenome]